LKKPSSPREHELASARQALADLHLIRKREKTEGKPPLPGNVAVHNHVAHGPQTRNGVNGFRFWSEPISDELELCDCGWHAIDPPHYRIANIGPFRRGKVRKKRGRNDEPKPPSEDPPEGAQ
jgi:hypothetical protein